MLHVKNGAIEINLPCPALLAKVFEVAPVQLFLALSDSILWVHADTQSHTLSFLLSLLLLLLGQPFTFFF